MAGLGYAQVSLRDADTGTDITVFDVDPESYDPFNVPIRGSVHVALDGTVTHQTFGVNIKDFRIAITGRITELDTVKALWTKYLNRSHQWEWRDWYGNRFRVIFDVGTGSFHPVPIPGAANAFTYSMNLSVISVSSWFGGAYG